MKTLKEILRSQILKDGELDIYNLNVELWPDDQDDEAMDLENHEFNSLTDEEFIMCCGGDWQDPVKVYIRAVDGKLKVVRVDYTYEEGMTEEEFINQLNN